MRIEIYGFMLIWCIISGGFILFADKNEINLAPLTIVFLIGYILIAIIGTIFEVYLNREKTPKTLKSKGDKK